MNNQNSNTQYSYININGRLVPNTPAASTTKTSANTTTTTNKLCEKNTTKYK